MIGKTKLPKELKPFIGEYFTALQKREKQGLLGQSEWLCFKRFLDLYSSGKYRFAAKSMDYMFRFLNLLIFIDEKGKPQHLQLRPVQKFIMCGIFGLRRPDGGYLINTANIYMARRNGKSFLLSGVLHYLMCMAKFRNELIILASCKGQNAKICFKEFCKFIDNDHFLKENYGNVNKTECYVKNKITGNELVMFRTGAGAKKELDGFTNRVAVIDEEMLCDEIIPQTIQDGQAHYSDSLLVTMSTAQFSIGGTNHKKWMTLRKILYADKLPPENFLFLCEPDQADLEEPDFTDPKLWGKANPVLLFEDDGYTLKKAQVEKYKAMAQKAVAEKGFRLQSFATKQCNVWFSAEDKSLCTYEQMRNSSVDYSFDDCVDAGYKDWYLGIDLSQSLDLTSVMFLGFVGEDQNHKLVPFGNAAENIRLFIHCMSWIPKNRLQGHIESDKFPYQDYVDTELFLCNGAGGENIDSRQVFEKIDQIRQDHDLHYVTIAADPYGIAGVQDSLAEICDQFILQNQSPKALSQYIESLSVCWKDGNIAYQKGHEDIFEKAMTNAVMVRNPTGYYSLEKITMRADSSVRIDPVDAMLTGFIAPYIDYNRRRPVGDELVDDWLDIMKG